MKMQENNLKIRLLKSFQSITSSETFDQLVFKHDTFVEQKLFCLLKYSVKATTHAKALVSFFYLRARTVLKINKKAKMSIWVKTVGSM